MKKILIAGGTGFIGNYLHRFFTLRGFAVFVLTRHKSQDFHIAWHPEKKEVDVSALEGFQVYINLVGESIAKGAWTKKRKKRLLDSRVESTAFLRDCIEKLQKPPEVFISASGTGYYGDGKLLLLDDQSPKGEGFLADLCEAWENAAKTDKTRVVHARLGVVIGEGGGYLQETGWLYKLGLSASFGSGKQYVSWVFIQDLAEAMLFAINNRQVVGATNFCSPFSLQNADFVKQVAEIFGKKSFLRLPSFLLSLFFGAQKSAELFLFSQNTVPKKLQDAGFRFNYSMLENIYFQ
jgi:uncharacterized protein (TIGR01777 family)